MTSRRSAAIALVAALIVPAGPAGATGLGAERASGAAGVSGDGPARPGSVTASIAESHRVLVRWATSGGPSLPTPSAGVGALAQALDRTQQQAAVKLVRTAGSGDVVYDVGRRLGADAGAIVDAIARIPGVLSARPDLWMTADSLPNDTLAGQLWGLQGPGDGSAYGLDVQTAWATSTGTGIVVAVIDTGIVAHPDLAGQTVAGYDMISDTAVSNDGNGRDANPADPGDWCNGKASTWHGTHVAGTIAALANNSLGVFGGAPGVKIEPVRVLGTCGGYSSDIADGIRWAAGGTVPGVPANANPARVLNLSLGGLSLTCPPEYTSAIADARSRGAIVVVSAGNSNADSDVFSPANCPDAVTVAAIDDHGIRASFSNYGEDVDIAGQGVAIWSTIDSGTTAPAGATYAAYSGTSMAAPHVALAAALVAAVYPSLTPSGVEVVLEDFAMAFPADGSGEGCPDLGCGHGIVTAAGALTGLAAATAPGAPGSVSASPSGGTALVSWSAPESDGGTTITGYTVTSSPGGKTCTWSSGPRTCTVTGLADGLHTFTVVASNAVGEGPASAPSSQIRIDTAAPSASAPVATIVAGSTAGSTASIRLAWTGADAGSGIAGYQVALSTNGGSYAVLANPTAASYTKALAVSSTTTYRFRIRAYDGAGNVSASVYGPTFRVKRIQQTNAAVRYSGSWKTGSSDSASGDSYRYTSTSGHSASYTFTGRSVAVVAYRSAALGSFKIYIDGVYKGSVSEHDTSTTWRRIVSSLQVSSGTHTIKIVCSGTAGHPKINLDAFLVLS